MTFPDTSAGPYPDRAHASPVIPTDRRERRDPGSACPTSTGRRRRDSSTSPRIRSGAPVGMTGGGEANAQCRNMTFHDMPDTPGRRPSAAGPFPPPLSPVSGFCGGIRRRAVWTSKRLGAPMTAVRSDTSASMNAGPSRSCIGIATTAGESITIILAGCFRRTVLQPAPEPAFPDFSGAILRRGPQSPEPGSDSV